MNLTINGRGRLVAEAHAYGGSCTILIDDNRNPAFWAELQLTAEQLLELHLLAMQNEEELDWQENHR